MSCIARQSPQLPPLLQAQLISCFATAVKHSKVLPKLIDPPKIYTDDSGSYATDVSVYQTLVLAMGNMKESAPAVRYCKEALHWSALADSCDALCAFAEELPSALVTIAEAASHRVAATHKMRERDGDEKPDDEEEDGEGDNDSGKSEDCGMTEACALLHSLALKGDTAVHTMLSALTISMISQKVNYQDGITSTESLAAFRLSLYELLQQTGIVSSLAALTALAQAANELSSLCEWGTPYREHMVADASACRAAVLIAVAALMSLDDGLGFLLISSNGAAVQLIWQYLSHEESIMTCQSISELNQVSKRTGSNGFLSLHPSSVGWIIWLAAYSTVLANSVVSAATELKSCTDPADGEESPSKRKSMGGGHDKQTAQEQAKMFEAVEALNAATYSSAGCSVVVRVVSQFCLVHLIEVAQIGPHVSSGGTSNTVSSAARLVFLCALSGDPAAIIALSKVAVREEISALSQTVAQSLPLSLSKLEKSVSAAAAAKHTAKTIDPRHRTAKVEVVRGYTDDARLLANDVIRQLLIPSAPTVESADGVKAVCETDIDFIARCKASLRGFVSMHTPATPSEGVSNSEKQTLEGLLSGLPALTLAANMLFSSLRSASSKLAQGTGFKTADTRLDPVHDGNLLHDSLNVLELLSHMAAVSEVSVMRYGPSCPTSLDALILADTSKTFLSGTQLPGRAVKVSGQDPAVETAEADDDVPGESKASDKEAVAERMSAIIREADGCLGALKGVLRLILEILRVAGPSMRCDGIPDSDTDLAVRDRVLNAVMEARAAAMQVTGEDKAGSLCSSVREVNALTTDIFALYCPRLEASRVSEITVGEGNSEACIPDETVGSTAALVALIARKSIHCPATLSSNLSLLIDLMPLSAGTRDSSDDAAATYDIGNESSRESIYEEGCKSNKWRELRLQKVEKDLQYLRVWESFCWRRSTATVVDDMNSPEEIEKKKEEELFKGSGSMVVPVDPLYSDLNPPKGQDPDGKISLLTLILYSMGSSSQSIHRLAMILCMKSMCLGPGTASRISRAIVNTIQRRAAVHLDFTVNSSEVNIFTPEPSLCRMLLFAEALCMSETLCVALVQEGLLLPSLQCLRGSTEKNVCLLAIQLITTINRTLLRMMAASDRASNGGVHGNEILRRQIQWVTCAVSDALSVSLPIALVSFQDTANGVLIWQQAVLSMILLPSACVRRVIEMISNTITLEGLAVKLWLGFEDCYQQLYEVTELMKLCQAHPEEQALHDLMGDDNGYGALRSTHIMFTGAACALRAVIDFALAAFLEGAVALPTLARAFRTSLSDPKRVVLRYQRAYTMWAVQARQTSSSSSSSGASDLEKSSKRSAVYVSFASGSTSDPQSSAAFDVRHQLISTALRSAVESTGRVARLVAGREIRPKGGNGLIKNEREPVAPVSAEFDFYRPFLEVGAVDGDVLPTLFACTTPSVRLPNLTSVRTGGWDDTLHTVFRRAMLDGDDTEPSIFNGCVTAHLKAAKSILRKGNKRKWMPPAKKISEVSLPPQMPTFKAFKPASRFTSVPAPSSVASTPSQGPPMPPRGFTAATAAAAAPPPPLFVLPHQQHMQQQHQQHQQQQQQQQQHHQQQYQQHLSQQESFVSTNRPLSDFKPPSAPYLQAKMPPPPLPPRRQTGQDSSYAPQPSNQRW
jgi:hypothetical protein